MNRAEYKYNMAMDILAWADWTGKKCRYTEEQLRDMPVPRLEQLHQEYYWARHDQMTAIGRMR